MINVLYILDYGTIGGATKAFITLVEQMRKYDINPLVVTSKKDELNEILERDGIKTIPAGHYTAIEPFSFKSRRWPYLLVKCVARYYYNDFAAVRKLSKSIDLSEIDIIHTNSARNTLGCRLSKKYGIPHVVHIREFGDKDFECVKLNPRYISLLNKYTITFLSVSNAVRKYWNSKGILSEKNQTIYDGVSFEDISVSSDEAKKRPALKMVINGGVGLPKGQHLAIDAMALLPQNIRNNITLDIAGWGDRNYIKAFMEVAKNAGFDSQVNYLGSINDVHQRIGDSQIGLMCSRSEGFGLVTAEYMHGRLGVIASNAGASPELIEDGVTGLLFESGNAQSLADCITKLFNDRELLVKLSNAAQAKARAMFTQQKNAESIYEVYNQIIKKN